MHSQPGNSGFALVPNWDSRDFTALNGATSIYISQEAQLLSIMRALSESLLDVKYSLNWESPFRVVPNSFSLMQLTQFSASSQTTSKEAPREQSMS